MTNRSIPRERRYALQQGLEQLAVWLNYDDTTKHFVSHLLSSEYVRPFFREYRRDYLEPAAAAAASSSPLSCSTPSSGVVGTGANTTTTTTTTTTKITTIEGVGCDELFRWVRDKNAFHQPKYYASSSSSNGSNHRHNSHSHHHSLNKKGWTPLDHAARFVVRVLRFSWDNGGEWSHGRFDPDDDESDLEFYQVWAVLRYLQAEWEAANLEAWDPDSLMATLVGVATR